MNEDFEGTFSNEPVVQDGNLITSRSAGTAVEFSFEIVRYLLGEKALDDLKKNLLY